MQTSPVFSYKRLEQAANFASNPGTVLRMAGVVPSDAELQALPERTTVHELKGLLKRSKSPKGRNPDSDLRVQLEHVCHLIDRNHYGYLTRSELAQALCNSGGEPLTQQEAEDFLKDVERKFTHPETGHIDIGKFVDTVMD